MTNRRRTLKMFDQLDTVRAQGAVAALTGAGVSDALLLEDGKRQRIRKAIASWAHARGMQTICFSQGWGPEHITAPGVPGPQDDPPGKRLLNPDEQYSALIDDIRESATPTVLLVDWTDILLQDAGAISDPQAIIIQRTANLAGDGLWRKNGHFVILLVRSGTLNRRLAEYPGVSTITVAIPDAEERRLAITSMAADQDRRLHLAANLSPERAAVVAGGLQLDDLIRLRDVSALTPISEEEIVLRKSEAIRRQAGDTLMVYDTSHAAVTAVAGLHGVKLALDELELVGVNQPRILLTGPAGCGKSTSHRFIAHHRGEPAIQLNHVREKWVGSSEERMDQAWETMNGLAPVSLMIDECETELGRRASNSDDASRVDSTLRSKLFAHLGDTGTQTRGSVIAATNRIDLMDEAAVDRFIVVPAIHPVGDEVVEIMAIHAARSQRPFDTESVARAIVNAPTMSGRQAVRLVDRSAVHAARRKSPAIEGQDVAAALQESMYRLSDSEIFQALLAIRYTTFTPYLPWNAAAARGFDMRWPDYLNGVVAADGSVKLGELNKRLNDMHQAGVR